MSLHCRCYACCLEIQAGDAQCPHCGASFAAPACPNCGQPVAEAREARDAFNTPSWNTAWRQGCVNCGERFVSDTVLLGGHEAALADETAITAENIHNTSVGHCKLQIRGGVSSLMRCDSWDHQPTIEITVERDAAGYGHQGKGLERHARVVLSVTECQELIRQLTGPLRVLLQCQPWWYDTT